MPSLPPPRLVENGIDDRDAHALIDWMRWWRPLRIVRLPAPGFRHPWDIVARWSRDSQSWEIQIEPGYVNGAEVRSAAAADAAALSDRPWRAIAAGQMRTVDGIPPFFTRLGVRAADAVSQSEFGLATNFAGTLEDRAKARRLRAVDILLEQPRPRVESVIERGPGGAAQLVATLTTPADAAPRIALRREAYDPQPETGSIQDLLATGAADEGLDRLRLGTLYLVSQPGETAEGDPDETWQPYPVNRVFWNLSHAVTRDLGVVEPFTFNLNVPLAGGVAQGIIGPMLAGYAAADAAAAAFLTRARVTGRFWSV